MHLPGYVLKRASTAAMAELNRKLASLHLRHAEVAFLMLLATTPGITQSAAGRLIDI
ncbi:MAG: MarR family transcriptional regulator, partial [Proteobacteria bacterium]|nr:MarR family transcriptional regulator [Pseudomonadota bacterium]